MPILGSLASASVQSFGSRGLVPTGSALYNSVNDYLRVPAGTAFQYGTGDFTIEMWIYPTTTSSPSGNGVTIFSQRGSDYRTQRYLFLFLWPTNQLSLQVAGNDWFVVSSNQVTLNAWNHVALVRRSGQMQLFLNGYANTPRVNTTNFSDASAYPLAFGNLVFNNTYTFQGYITNIRVAKSAYYITSFVPSRTPFTRTSQGATNVQLLLNFKNAPGLATDSSANSLTVTNSLVSYSTLSPFSGAFVTPPVVNAAAATVTPSTVTPNEGDAITFNVTVSNTPAGTYYWTIELPVDTPPSASDFSGGALSGSFTVTGTTGSFVITALSDRLTEGTETFSVFVRSGSTTGIVLGSTDEITIADISLTPTMTVSTGFSEGVMVSANVSNLGPAGTYFWSIDHITTNAADFSGSSGSFGTTILNESISIVTYSTADATTEGTQTFTISVRTGSETGPIIITSPTLSLFDTSLTQTATVTPTPNPVTEGQAVTVNVSTSNVPNGSTLTWNIIHGTTTAADFSASTGTFGTAFGSGSFSITTLTGDGSEAAQTFQVQVLGTLGTQIGISTAVTISANIT